jgi:uncharacterized protein YndB with AHSA1/START domain
MKTKLKTMDLTFERGIPASPGQVFDAWLDPKNPVNPWHDADIRIFTPKAHSLFYFRIGAPHPHYGRILKLSRPGKIQMTWMSPHTRGLESLVTVTFKKKGQDTLLKLVHSKLPDDEEGLLHKEGWDYYLAQFGRVFTAKKGPGR